DRVASQVSLFDVRDAKPRRVEVLADQKRSKLFGVFDGHVQTKHPTAPRTDPCCKRLGDLLVPVGRRNGERDTNGAKKLLAVAYSWTRDRVHKVELQPASDRHVFKQQHKLLALLEKPGTKIGEDVCERDRPKTDHIGRSNVKRVREDPGCGISDAFH